MTPSVRQVRRGAANVGWRTIVPEWAELVLAAPFPHFLKCDWVGEWLDVYGEELGTELWTYRLNSELCGACLLTERREWSGPLPIRSMHLNTSGEGAGEGVCAEYNQLLVRVGHEEEVARELGVTISESGVDELVVNGVSSDSLRVLRRALPGWGEELKWSEDRFVDLEKLREAKSDYRLTALSRNCRGQVNRSLNAYGELGVVRTEIADTVERAQEMLKELVVLHQRTWRQRRQAGAFASARYRRFHEGVVERLFGRNAIQLIRVSAGENTIGILYNYVDKNRVLFYQSGLNYRNDGRYRPGLVSHVCAIERCLELGFSEYHFLAGDEVTPRYKTSLSTNGRSLAWVRFRRPGPKAWVLDQLRCMKQRMRTIP